MNLETYASDLLGGEDDLLREMRVEAEDQGLPPIQVPFQVGRLLQVLVLQSRPQRVLEIGTLFGYSTILMARVLPAGGRLLTLEVSPRHAELAQKNFERARVADRIEIMVAPALQSLSGLREEPFDFVFIDADKQSYPEYLRHAMRLTRAGSTIVADNVWRGGSILHPDVDDEGGRGIAEFNTMIAREKTLLSVIVPTRNGEDGTSISVRR